MSRSLLNLALYLFSSIVPRSGRRVVCGAWLGHRYADNPRYVYEFLSEHRPDLEVVWCGREETRPAVSEDGRPWVRYGSVRAAIEILRAGTVFVSHGYRDLAPYNLTGGADAVYLGHGIAIKNMGSQARSREATGLASLFEGILEKARGCSFFVASSQIHAQKLREEFSSENCREDNTLLLGQPRCDLFLEPDVERRSQTMRRRLSEAHGVPEEKRLVTYMPTFRDRGLPSFSFRDLQADAARQLTEILDSNEAVLVERRHLVDGVLRNAQAHDGTPGVIDLSSAPGVDSNELLLATDVLITDYSGCYIDYLLLDRPVIHFVYDYREYTESDRGLYFDLDQVAGGTLIHEQESLMKAVDDALAGRADEAALRRGVREMLLANEDGHSTQNVAQRFVPPLEG